MLLGSFVARPKQGADVSSQYFLQLAALRVIAVNKCADHMVRYHNIVVLVNFHLFFVDKATKQM